MIAREKKYPDPGNLQQLDGLALQQVALQMTDGWHPRLQQLVRDSDPSTTICKALQTMNALFALQHRALRKAA